MKLLLIIVLVLGLAGSVFYLGYTEKEQEVQTQQAKEYKNTRERVEDATSNPLGYDAAVGRLQSRQNTNKH